jgi:nitroimidazol reductase NimA-like FMN-containing flavoprotein (pyridoxamine 5'-phosphate oxidase superfamily)
MRRSDRAITGRDDIDSILEREPTGHLGLVDPDEGPYVLPFNFFYDRAKARIYVHCASEGRKLDIIGKDPRACFEVCEVGLDTGADDQRCPERWKSVVAIGTIAFVEDPKEKLDVLNGLIAKYGRSHKPATEEQAKKTTILAIDISKVTGKTYEDRKDAKKK